MFRLKKRSIRPKLGVNLTEKFTFYMESREEAEIGESASKDSWTASTLIYILKIAYFII